MPITEFVFPKYKEGVAEEATAAATEASAAFDSFVLNKQIGSIMSSGGISTQHEKKVVFALEWDSVDAFKKVYPESREFQSFVSQMLPYLAGPPAPQLFAPSASSPSARSDHIFASPLTQIFIGQSNGEKNDVENAWGRLVAALGDGKGEVKSWNGWGVESAEGSFAGLLGWESVDAYEESIKKGEIKQAVERVKGTGLGGDYVVRFAQ